MNISAYMSSIRPYRWMSLYNRLKATNLSFDINIVGPTDPDFDLPHEINFYKSDVKPSQCFHAAGQMCRGETMLQMVDDLEYTPDSIEDMFNVVMSADNIMATAHYYQNDIDHTIYQNIAGGGLDMPAYLPLLPVCGMFRRQAWVEHKGLDRRFEGVMSELDFYMRLRINGLDTHFVNGIVREDTQHQNRETTSLCIKHWDKDRPTFVKLWSSRGILYPIRNDIMRPFVDENLLTVNQSYDA